MSIQYKVLGFEPTTFRLRVSSHNHLSQLSTPGNVYKIDDVCRRHPQTFIFEFEAEFFLVKKVLQYLTLKNMFLEHFKRIY